jgi:hypothetical protein
MLRKKWLKVIMLRYKINAYPSKKIQQKFFYTLKTRNNSIYGVHKETSKDVSKTSLVVFMQAKGAQDFKCYLEKHQAENLSYSRTLENVPVTYAMQIQSTSKMPLRLQKVATKQLLLSCMMNYFDLLIVSKLEENGSVLDLYCFEFGFDDLPSRSMINFSLREMLEL